MCCGKLTDEANHFKYVSQQLIKLWQFLTILYSLLRCYLVTLLLFCYCVTLLLSSLLLDIAALLCFALLHLQILFCYEDIGGGRGNMKKPAADSKANYEDADNHRQK